MSHRKSLYMNVPEDDHRPLTLSRDTTPEIKMFLHTIRFILNNLAFVALSWRLDETTKINIRRDKYPFPGGWQYKIQFF